MSELMWKRQFKAMMSNMEDLLPKGYIATIEQFIETERQNVALRIKEEVDRRCEPPIEVKLPEHNNKFRLYINAYCDCREDKTAAIEFAIASLGIKGDEKSVANQITRFYTKEEALKLKACPFCGSKKIVKATYGDTKEIYLECEGCWSVIKRLK